MEAVEAQDSGSSTPSLPEHWGDISQSPKNEEKYSSSVKELRWEYTVIILHSSVYIPANNEWSNHKPSQYGTDVLGMDNFKLMGTQVIIFSIELQLRLSKITTETYQHSNLSFFTQTNNFIRDATKIQIQNFIKDWFQTWSTLK